MKIVIRKDAAESYRMSCRINGQVNPALFKYEWFQTLKAVEGKSIEVDTKYLFSDQFNTLPIDGLSENGLRIMGDSVAEVIDDIRHTVGVCNFCGNHTPGKVKGFCEACTDSPYLSEDDVKRGANQIRPANAKRGEWKPLTDKEFAAFLPVYIKRQTTGKDSRNAARLRKIRSDLKKDAAKKIRLARMERDGFLWMMDHGIETENCIFYNHTEKFCFGWRQPIAESVKVELEKKLEGFPFVVEFKTANR